MTPYEAITADPPNVWLTAFYGFDPAKWGFLGFANEGQRKHFITNTRPGAMVVIYGHKSKSEPDQQGQIIGLQQVSHRVNTAKAFMDPVEWAAKESDPDTRGKWDVAVKAVRAWKVVPESYQLIDGFADESYTTGRAQFIGSQGVRLTRNEADKLLDLTLVETTVFGEIPVDHSLPVVGRDVLRPSEAGPVSQYGHFVKESEGPKENYILRLNGDAEAFLGYTAKGCQIIKVGMSASPQARCDAFNTALPAGAFRWEVILSNSMDDRPAYQSSRIALIGEASLKMMLARDGTSLGGEFFLASEEAIAKAWQTAKAETHKHIALAE